MFEDGTISASALKLQKRLSGSDVAEINQHEKKDHRECQMSGRDQVREF